MSVTASMRQAADILESVARIYNLSPQPSNVKFSANWLRHEADVLDRPIPEEAE